eukprot:TRINITY_DN4125_c0_g1_i1.p1 TRINITY_DN4125_c0_g1~~TRINITY_DN4125_c0_g1_i1.p1  ORF type:complete len:599 (+),score=161.54 TRINITY_DN4125_c0_g1_i1:69-1865(+)
MDKDSKLIALLDSLGAETDVDFATQVLEAHDWDLQAALETVTGDTAHRPSLNSHGLGPDDVRSPMATGYVDRLIGPTPNLDEDAMLAMALDPSAAAAMEDRSRGDLDGALRASERDFAHQADLQEQAALAEAIQASYAMHIADQTGSIDRRANAESDEQRRLNSAIEASYQVQNAADADFRKALELSKQNALACQGSAPATAARRPGGCPAPTASVSSARPYPATASSSSRRALGSPIASQTAPSSGGFGASSVVRRPATSVVQPVAPAARRTSAGLGRAAEPRPVPQLGRATPSYSSASRRGVGERAPQEAEAHRRAAREHELKEAHEREVREQYVRELREREAQQVRAAREQELARKRERAALEVAQRRQQAEEERTRQAAEAALAQQRAAKQAEEERARHAAEAALAQQRAAKQAEEERARQAAESALAQQRAAEQAAAQAAASEEAERFAAREAEELRREREEAEMRRREAEAPAEEQREVDPVVQALQGLRRLHLKRDPAALAVCLQTLRTYISNLASNPQEPKYQRINCENAAFRAKVSALEGAVTVLEACGFEQEGSTLQVSSEFLKAKGPKLFDALSKVDVLLEHVKSLS